MTAARLRAVKPLVGIIMGSKSDWETMSHAADTLSELGVPFEVKVVSDVDYNNWLASHKKTASNAAVHLAAK